MFLFEDQGFHLYQLIISFILDVEALDVEVLDVDYFQFSTTNLK